MGPEEVVKSWTKPDGTCDMVKCLPSHCSVLLMVLLHNMQLAGIVYLSPGVAKNMVDLHTLPPLDACTYFGLDNGAQPLSVRLYTCPSLSLSLT